MKHFPKFLFEDNIKSIYVAGPMRGRECFNFESFFFWARVLRESGMDVKNPAQIDCKKMLSGWQFTEDQYADVLLKDFEIIKDVDALWMMNDWRESPGATAEHAFAEALGKKIFYEE